MENEDDEGDEREDGFLPKFRLICNLIIQPEVRVKEDLRLPYVPFLDSGQEKKGYRNHEG